MKKNETIPNIYLINLIKFKSRGPMKPINIEKEYKRKDKFISKELTFLSSKSMYFSYFKELERLSKLNKEKLIKQKTKVQIKKETNKDYSNKLLKIIKGSCNKMVLDIIYNNPKLRRNFLYHNKNYFSNDNKKKLKLKLDWSNSVPFLKQNLKKCHTDNINFLSKKNSYNYFKHSLSFLSPKNQSSSLRKRFKPIKSLNTEGINNVYKSQDIIKENKNKKNDKIKGMLTINYNNFKYKMNNNIKKCYSYYKNKNNMKL